MHATEVLTADLRMGDVLLDSGTTDIAHPIIFDVVLGITLPEAPAVMVKVLTERHAYGKVTPGTWWSGIGATHHLLARMTDDGNGWRSVR